MTMVTFTTTVNGSSMPGSICIFMTPVGHMLRSISPGTSSQGRALVFAQDDRLPTASFGTIGPPREAASIHTTATVEGSEHEVVKVAPASSDAVTPEVPVLT